MMGTKALKAGALVLSEITLTISMCIQRFNLSIASYYGTALLCVSENKDSVCDANSVSGERRKNFMRVSRFYVAV